MSATDVISPDLSDSVQNCLGERFQHGSIKVVRMETKGDKLESKVLVLSKYRAFILSFKVPTKVEHEFNFLEIHNMESLKPLQLKLHVTIKKDSLPKTVYTLLANSTEDIDSIIETIALEIRKCFPNVFPIERIIPRITTKPESRVINLNMKLEESFPDSGPCGGFTQMYGCMCDLHQEPYMPEVAWDVDTIYLSHDSKELCLNDFDHLSNRDLVPIIAALIHNDWFTKLSFRNASKLSADAMREINKMLQKSSHLEQLILENVGLKWSFMEEMGIAVMSNQNTVLRTVNLSNNSLDDRGIRHLASLLTRLPCGLLEINLAKTGLTAEGTLYLGKALTQNNFMSTTLVKLNVAGNQFKDGDISNLTGFLAQPNSLTHLNLADTECALDNVFVALFRGCSANLSHLNLAGNTFTYRRGKSVPIQVSFKQFFATCTSLKYLNLSRNKLPPEVVKEVLIGIGGNNNLKDVELDLSSNELKIEGGQVVAGSIAHVNNITTLNLSDNDFNVELGRLVDWIGQNKTIQSLDISKNMGSLKYKQLLKVLETIVQVIQNEELSLHSLSLADNKMKFETIQIINALGSNTTLTSIDISGNGMGDIGARMLAKALQLNTKLHTVKLDSNGITFIGFNDLVNALEKNYTLKYMPTPVNDITASLKTNPEKTSSALQKIQNLLQRNHSEHKFQDKQAFRLQQGFLYTTSHRMVDKLVVQIQDCIKGLIDCTDDEVQADINRAQVTILDADNSKLLLAALQEVALKIIDPKDKLDDKLDDSLDDKLDDMANQLRRIVETQLNRSATGMIDTASKQCNSVMENSFLREGLENMCQQQIKLPQRFLQDVVEQVSAAISNRMGEAHLAMASHISDTIIDELMEQLTECYQKLSDQLTDYRVRQGSILPNGTEIEASKDEGGDKEAEKMNEMDETKEDASPKSPDAESLPTSLLSNQRMSRYLKREMGRGDSIRFKDSEAGQQRRIGKVRPRSVIMKDYQLAVVEIDDADSGDKLDNDVVDDAVTSKPLPATPVSASPTGKSSPLPKKATKKATAADTKALDQLTTSTEILTDVRKGRPRPPRKRPLRPVNQAHKISLGAQENTTADPVDAGISAFFSANLVQPKPEVSISKQITNSDASPDMNKKKKTNRLFHKKEKHEEKPKKEEAVRGKKFAGLKGIFKRKQSMPSTEELDQSVRPDTRKGSLPNVINPPEQPTVPKEANKVHQEEPLPQIVEKKALKLPSIQRSLKSVASPPKQPEPEVKLPLPIQREEDTTAGSKEEAEAVDRDDVKSHDEKAAVEEGSEAGEEVKEDTPLQEKKEPEVSGEAKEDEQKEKADEEKKKEEKELEKKELEKELEKKELEKKELEKKEIEMKELKKKELEKKELEKKELEKKELEKKEEEKKELEKKEEEKKELEKKELEKKELEKKEEEKEVEQKEEKGEDEKEEEKREEEKKEVEKEEEKKEEQQKPISETRKPGLAGAQMIGGLNMLEEMKLKREQKAADRASREILESQAPKVEENQVSETPATSGPAPSSPEKPLPKFKLPLPKLSPPGPTSPPSWINSPTSPLRVSPVKPSASPRSKGPLESPRKSPLEKVPSYQSPSETLETKVLPQTNKEDVQPTPAEASEKPKIEKERPAIRPRPLSGKIDAAQPKSPPPTPTSPEFALKPSGFLKRNSGSGDQPATPEKTTNGTDIPKPASRLGLEAEDKPAEVSAGKSNGTTLSPRQKPKPMKRPISIVPAKKPEISELRKANSPAINVAASPPKLELKQTTSENTQLKSSSLHRDPASKPPPMVASKPRSRSLDPSTTAKLDPKPSVKGDILLEVPSHDSKRDSVLSKSSDEGAMEDPDQYSAL